MFMFPKPVPTPNGIAFPPKWTMAQLDELDVHFFYSVLEVEDGEETTESSKGDTYLSDVW